MRVRSDQEDLVETECGRDRCPDIPSQRLVRATEIQRDPGDGSLPVVERDRLGVERVVDTGRDVCPRAP